MKRNEEYIVGEKINSWFFFEDQPTRTFTLLKSFDLPNPDATFGKDGVRGCSLWDVVRNEPGRNPTRHRLFERYYFEKEDCNKANAWSEREP